MRRTLWISAGELSGDMQAGALAWALLERDPELCLVGMGGPHLAAAGQRNLFTINALSVMGVVETFTALPRALRLLRQIRAAFLRLKPAAVIVVDAPSFNFRVAALAVKLGIPVYSFIPPKVWATRESRVHFMRRHFRRIFCILPFEPAFYAGHGVKVDYVGNPLVDLVRWPVLCQKPPVAGRIGLMPGSRRKEVESLMPAFGEAARLLLARFPQLSFHCLRAPNVTEDSLRALWPADIPLTVDAPEDRYAAMRSCQLLLAASGTATLESGLLGVPTVVAYRLSAFSGWLIRKIIHVRWVSLTNLILNKTVFPELLQQDATGERMAEALANWLEHPEVLRQMRKDLQQLRRLCGQPGSAARTADLVLRALKEDAPESADDGEKP